MATITQTEGKERVDRIAFRVDGDLFERINIEALRRRVPVNQLCIEAITDHLDALKAAVKRKN